MAVPDYQSFMLPLLNLAADGKEHSLSEVNDTLAKQFKLAEDDIKELLPSGNEARLYNRVRWASIYLRKALLLESSGKGRFRITKRGLEVLSTNLQSVNSKYLERFDEFRAFKGSSIVKPPGPEMTPEEILESSYQSLRRTLAQELLDRLKKCSPAFFERVVVDLLVSMGYGGSRKDAGQAIGRSGDEGVDGIIKEDRLGLDVVYVQAKRWESTVGRKEVQSFAGSLMGLQADKGVFITTSQFSQDATAYVSKINKKIVLIDGEQLAQYMIDHDVGVTEVTTYVVKKMDLDYFDEQG